MLGHGPGGFLGAMALLTETSYRGTTFAVVDTVLFEVDGEELRRLAFAHPPLLRRFLPAFESVSQRGEGHRARPREAARRRQLAAGPRARAQQPGRRGGAGGRDAARGRARRARSRSRSSPRRGTPAEGLAALVALGPRRRRRPNAERLDPLAESDREDALADALRARGVAGAAGSRRR